MSSPRRRPAGQTVASSTAARVVASAAPLSEKEWQSQVISLARLLGWSWFHTHDSRRSPAGFPDLVLWRERVVFAELKTDTGRLTPEQRDTIATMAEAGVAVHLWRPRDFDEVKAVLERRGA
jgi:hypothetical protein